MGVESAAFGQSAGQTFRGRPIGWPAASTQRNSYDRSRLARSERTRVTELAWVRLDNPGVRL